MKKNKSLVAARFAVLFGRFFFLSLFFFSVVFDFIAIISVHSHLVAPTALFLAIDARFFCTFELFFSLALANPSFALALENKSKLYDFYCSWATILHGTRLIFSDFCHRCCPRVLLRVIYKGIFIKY